MSRYTLFEKAQRKVNAIKAFYNHLAIFVLLNTILLVLKGSIVRWFLENSADPNVEFLKWIDWNILAVPIIWSVVIIFHGSYVYGPFLMKKE